MKNTSEGTTNCLFCGESVRGRSDKKYCNDFCRNAHNNKLKTETHHAIRGIELALKKNRKVIKELLGKEDYKIISRHKLVQKGFDERYHTHHFASKQGAEYTFCYDYGYREKEDGQVSIVKAFPRAVDVQ